NQAMRGLPVILPYAFLRQHAQRKEKVFVVFAGLRHGLIGEISEHDNYAYRAAQWRRRARRCRANDARSGAQRELFRRNNHPIVETEHSWLRRAQTKRRWQAQSSSHRLHCRLNTFAKLWMRRDHATRAVSARASSLVDARNAVQKCFVGHRNTIDRSGTI